ncbi:glucan 1,3 beta-glucosidase [Coprinopsis cinerea okayama7|uniref:glucan endo-1,3-beta-D-glucosidase n=1 Tax=Coprinopsis cinerea (strain Okayama-7 / 130 / ATCC MYA-4618 / FGSC 9003) TaxID=240176 RepID=A8NX33_COPC7|nr:glucan 1,3 beta-glucosidase [Coprinopsis cinerea okayama7\|eukprot:XP_001837054.2 glucan 1,3 beta-glucosidase [Coprinopsis cinerea okayama7\
MSAALEASKARSRRSKWLVIGSILGLLILAGIGTAVGVIVTRNNSKDASTSSGKGGSGSSGSDGPGKPSGNDPSVFELDPNLRKSFYGMAYTPHNALIDLGCANTLEGTIRDIQLLSQLTTRIRLYGADCNQTAQVLEAIKQTKVDMEVFVGIYTVPDDDEAFLRQSAAIREAIETYGTDNIGGVTVGNEFMLNWVTGRGSNDPNSAIGQQGAEILIRDIQATRDMLAEMNLDKDIPVGNSDAGSFFNDDVLAAIDYGLSNVHAWFANTTAEAAADWVFDFFEESNVRPAALLPNNPRMYIAETGWPTGAKDVGAESNGFARADTPSLQVFLDTFVCQANAAGIGYFYFEMFDEKWKDDLYGGVEGYWGLFNGDRTLKDVVIPDCPPPE